MPKKWRGLTISFGMVSIPVGIGKMVDDNGVSGSLLCPDHGLPVKQKWECEEGKGHTLDKGQLDLGYKFNGHFVTPDKGAVQALRPDVTNLINLRQFCPVEQIDPVWYETTYLMWPDSGGEQGFYLLADELSDKGMAGLATTVLTNRERLVVMRWSPVTGSLVLHLCHFHEQLRWKDITEVEGLAKGASEAEKELHKMANTLVSSMEGPFHPQEYADLFKEELIGLISATAKGKPIPSKAPKEPVTTTPVDMVDALKQSIAAQKKPAKKPVKKPTTRKRTASR